MKRFIALFLIIGMIASVSGCATACRDGQKVTQILQSIVTDAQAVLVVLSATVPIPPQAQLVIAAAQTAINMANAAMKSACPSVTDIQNVQNQMNQTMTMFKTSGMTLKK